MSKKRMLLPVGILVLGGIALAVWFVFSGGKQTPPDTLRLYGNVDLRQVRLAFQSTGRISRIDVQEGAAVAPGQLVARIDPVRYEAAADRARAQVADRRQVLARLLAGSRPEEIAAARARVDESLAALRDAEKTYRRANILAKTEYVPKQKRDDAEAALKAARARLDAARQQLALAVKGPRKEDIAAARARLASSRAALKLAAQELADTRLYAPANGVVQDRLLEPGDMAFPQTPVLTLALTNPLWVRAYVEEPDLGKIAPGIRAEVATDSFPGKKYRGWVGYISPTAEFTPKQVETAELRSKLVYQVRIYVCNPQNELRLGMPVTVNVPLNQDRKEERDGTRLDRADPCAEAPRGGGG